MCMENFIAIGQPVSLGVLALFIVLCGAATYHNKDSGVILSMVGVIGVAIFAVLCLHGSGIAITYNQISILQIVLGVELVVSFVFIGVGYWLALEHKEAAVKADIKKKELEAKAAKADSGVLTRMLKN